MTYCDTADKSLSTVADAFRSHTQIMGKHLSWFMHHTSNIWQFCQSIPKEKNGGNLVNADSIAPVGCHVWIYYIYMRVCDLNMGSETMKSMNSFNMSAIPDASGNFN
jgi:hypothetical protein